MLCKVDTHSLSGNFIIPYGLEGTAVGRIDQKDNQGNTDGCYQHRDKGREFDGLSCELELESAGPREALEDVGAIGDRTELAPLKDCTDNLRKTESCNGKVVTFQLQNWKADQISEESCCEAGHQDCQDNAENGSRGSKRCTEHLREGNPDCRIIILINRITGGSRNGENGIGIGTDEHKTSMAEGEEAGITVEKVHGNCCECID